MAKVNMAIVPLLYLALLVSPIMISECFVKKSNVVCLDSEKQALLSFKQDIADDYLKSFTLSTWVSEEDECCKWDRVVCDNVTGHVSELRLSHAYLSGKISPSLLNLNHLTHLNLSYNSFDGIRIPSFLGSLVSLTHLDLTEAGSFVGMIPPQLGNLSDLHHLSIASSSSKLHSNNLDWLSGLSSLEYLKMSNVNISEASSNLFSPINKLSSLLELRLSNCELQNIHLPSSHVLNLTSIQLLDLSRNNLEGSSSLCSVLKTMTHLRSLDLSYNYNLGSTFLSCLNHTFTNLQHLSLRYTSLQGVFPSVISTMTSLVSLDLSLNSLQGKIPSSLGSSLCKLKDLDLSYNHYTEKLHDAFESLSGCLCNNIVSLDMSYNALTGEVPIQIEDYKNLTTLSLSSNKLYGPIPESLGSLSNLKYLYISLNLLQGVVTEAHLSNLTNLKSFIASGNSLTLSVTPHWIPPFNLDILELSDWKLGPHFPMWLKTQKNISKVELSNTGISDVIPNWFHNFSSQLNYVQLSHNHLYGVVPIWFWDFTSQLSVLILSHNHLHGTVPYVHALVTDLSFNEFTGSLPRTSFLIYTLDLSSNSFSGKLSSLLCNNAANESRSEEFRLGGYSTEVFRLGGYSIEVLRLGDNLLAGNIPSCWEHRPWLEVLDLRSNYLIGEIPPSMGLLSGLRSLSLGNNNLTGKIPTALKNFSGLKNLNLGHNKLVGTIPRWIGSFPYLIVLILRSNKLNGDIPVELCALDELQILDVADNNLYGVIPRCFLKNLFAVAPTYKSSLDYTASYNNERTIENAVLVTKGKEYLYESILGLVTTIDLSSNNLSGEIPEELTNLQGLRFLNLSRNHLRGSIPNKIGNMTSLESLDLSWNKLSGDIPPSMSSLTSLNFLNLSHNNLSGEIPKSTQLQSLNSSSFDGNHLLCGDPLPNRCRQEFSLHTDNEDDDKEDGEEYWFRLGVAVGFGVGFLGIIAPLVLCGCWRRAYFLFFQEYIWYKILDCIIKIKYITRIRKSLA